MTRRIILASCILCWIAAGLTLLADDAWDRAADVRVFLLAGAVSLLIWARTMPGPDSRRIGNLFYAMGVRDGIEKAATEGRERHTEVPTQQRRPVRAVLRRISGWSVVLPATVAAAAAVVVMGDPAYGMPADTRPGPSPSQMRYDDSSRGSSPLPAVAHTGAQPTAGASSPPPFWPHYPR